MLRAIPKICFYVLLLISISSNCAYAERNLYQSGTNPFIKMMLSMMDAMGLLDQLPRNGGYGGYGNHYNAYSGLSNPYAQALAMRGIYPQSSMPLQGVYGNSPFTRSPWLQSPWLQNSLPQSGLYNSAVSPVWGNPSWGVLPYDGYGVNSYSPYGYHPELWSNDLSGWVDEPWEESSWNDDAQPRVESPDDYQWRSQPSRQSPAATVPLVQNFNYNLPEGQQGAPQSMPQYSQQAGQQQVQAAQQQAQTLQQDFQQFSTDGEQQDGDARDADVPRRYVSQSPLSKLKPPGGQRRSANQLPTNARQNSPQPARQPQVARQPPGQQSPVQQQSRPRQPQQPKPQQPQQFMAGNPQAGTYGPGAVRPGVEQKPCITEFCGLKIPSLNGLWVAQDGEMLGVNRNRYLWTDGGSRYLTGKLKIQNEYLLASVDDHDKVMQFKYKLAGDHLLTLQPDGTIREFIRMPVNQYRDDYMGYSGLLR